MARKHTGTMVIAGVGLILLGVNTAPAAAVTADISHAYQASSAIQNGGLVSLDPHRSNFVVPANTGNSAQLVGLAVGANDSLIAVGSTPGTVQVATSGSAVALVSTLNGDIHVGDPVGVSPFNGVGIKALPGSRIVGLAQADFTSHTAGATTQRVTDKQGKSTSVVVGYDRVTIAIGSNGNVVNDANLNTLQRFAKSITGHTVPTQRVVISLAVAIVAILCLITLVYASIYGSILSIGRNPLAKYAVFRTLGSVLGLAILTTVIAGLIIFFLLR